MPDFDGIGDLGRPQRPRRQIAASSGRPMCATGSSKSPARTRSRPHDRSRARSCRHRQRAHGRAGRSHGAAGVVVLSALRQRSDLLPTAGGRRGEGIFRCRARRHGRLPVGISAQHRDRLDRTDRPQRRRGPHHRFRAALSAIRPHLSPAATHPDRSSRSPGCRASPSASARPTTTAIRSRQHSVGSNHIRYVGRGHRHPAHHRRAAVLYRARGAVRPRRARCIWCFGADEPFPGDLETTCREFCDRTRDYWMDWVARLSISYDWQDADHPRRDHAQAQQFRGDRRHHRRAHHLDSRKRRAPGAPGTIATAGCATPISS